MLFRSGISTSPSRYIHSTTASVDNKLALKQAVASPHTTPYTVELAHQSPSNHNGERLGTYHRAHSHRHLLRRSVVPSSQRRKPNGLAIYARSVCCCHVHHVGYYFPRATPPSYLAYPRRLTARIQWRTLAHYVCGS